MSDLFPLTVSGALVRRKGKILVGPVDLTIGGDGVTVVVGPNGAGKTSLLGMLHGILRLSDGQVDWACETDEARRQQAFVFQTPIVLRRSVLDNLIYPLVLRGQSRKQAREQARFWADEVGLSDALDRSATRLSGGERQKLALARALILQPAVLFLDEPCAALDGRATREIEGILSRAAEAGTRLIMSTHNMGQARRIGDDVIFMLGGKVHEKSPAGSFFDHPNTEEAAAFLRGDIVE